MRAIQQDGWHGYLSRRPNISRTMQDLDNNVICDIIIGNDVAGAVIGRRGANIKTIMMKSQALVSVRPSLCMCVCARAHASTCVRACIRRGFLVVYCAWDRQVDELFGNLPERLSSIK
jgi:hypothetical protein